MQLTRQQRNQLSLIGAAILDPGAGKDYIMQLSSVMFEEGMIRNLYGAIKELSAAGGLDVVALENKLGGDYRQLIVTAAETCPSVCNAANYQAFILEDYRKAQLFARMTVELAQDRSADAICSALRMELAQQDACSAILQDAARRDFDSVLDETMRFLDTPDNSLQFGWAEVDRFGCFQRGNAVVLSGRPGAGKTDLSVNLATRLSRKYRVYYLTLEETGKRLMMRILSKVCRIDSARMRDRRLNLEERSSLNNAAAALRRHQNMILDEGDHVTVEDIKARIIRARPDVVFVDHIGLIRPTNPKYNTVETLAEVTRELKVIAKSMDIVVVECAQLNRAVDKNGGARGATLSDLRGSGTIEMDTNCVWVIQNEITGNEILRGADDYKDVDIRINKNRDGGTGTFGMRWQPQYHSWQPTPEPDAAALEEMDPFM